MYLIKEKLLPIWDAGCVDGFVSMDDVTRALYHHPLKAIMFCFSEKTLGAVSVAFIDSRSKLNLKISD